MQQFMEGKFKPLQFKSKLPANPMKEGLEGVSKVEPIYLILDPKRTVM